MDGMTPELAKQAMLLAAAKLPVLTRIVHRSQQEL
jgi:ribosomal protein L16/L10AE